MIYLNFRNSADLCSILDRFGKIDGLFSFICFKIRMIHPNTQEASVQSTPQEASARRPPRTYDVCDLWVHLPLLASCGGGPLRSKQRNSSRVFTIRSWADTTICVHEFADAIFESSSMDLESKHFQLASYSGVKFSIFVEVSFWLSRSSRTSHACQHERHADIIICFSWYIFGKERKAPKRRDSNLTG